MIRFYLEKGRWRVTADGNAVPARAWWDAINHVKCLNHRLRTRGRTASSTVPSTPRDQP